MTEEKVQSNFIRTIIAKDLESNKHDGNVTTRFPPEPNGYLHIGHAKSICLNFGLANENEKGLCNLRFDDTNPEKESIEYIEAIKRDVEWLGFDWADREFYSSDYFEKLYDFAKTLIEDGKAYVCSLNSEDMREYRGTLTEPGKPSPDRDRSVEENLDLFLRMREGEFEDGTYTLRAKIDMAASNMNLRDPAIYRIKKVHHHRTGDAWCVYPMYDFTHCLSDSLENITHSICTLEFEDHRPLYDWFLDELKTKCHPQQIEFARLNLEYTVMSKRKLMKLVEENLVNGWDDPRMPTISGMRRRGYTSASIRNFCERIGVGKKESRIEFGMLEEKVREDLNENANRVSCVLNPIKVVIENLPEGETIELKTQNHPQKPEMGERIVPFSRELYIERDDFMEDPPKKFFRLGPGREVRLRFAFFLKCIDFKKDENGEVVELRCTYDPETLGGKAPDGRKVKGTIHWVSAKHALPVKVNIYDRLFTDVDPEESGDFRENINPDSIKVLDECRIEPSVKNAKAGDTFQFERSGYFCVDKNNDEGFVFNRTVTLRDTWAKMKK
jgi:glutaminyl-tRNA synthetase